MMRNSLSVPVQEPEKIRLSELPSLKQGSKQNEAQRILQT